ncbi:MAG: hypothetical protein P0S94_01165, partial [Simkaniaceae bacterium]|nr:hypothetical protein [Simkaniaceae bacterium]
RVVENHIHATVSKAPDEAEIVLFPKENYMPNLCIHKPLVICGQVKKPQDFEMILQGRAGSEWINIRLPISLSKAEKPERSIEKDFALFRALNQFDNYLEEGKIAHLEEAQDLIQSVQ